MARPSKLTDACQKVVIKAIKLGATYELAAASAGISYDTFNNWMKAGREELERREALWAEDADTEWAKDLPVQRFVEFFEAVKKAEGEAAVVWLQKIEQAAKDGEWQAAAWKLERRYPATYGKRVSEHTGVDGTPLKVIIEEVSDHDQ